MHLGHAPHVFRSDDLTLLRCKQCGWLSPELTQDEMHALGTPWSCDDCGRRVTSFIRFHPDEREAAYEAFDVSAVWLEMVE